MLAKGVVLRHPESRGNHFHEHGEEVSDHGRTPNRQCGTETSDHEDVARAEGTR